MQRQEVPTRPQPIARLPRFFQALLLLLVSGVVTLVMEIGDMPAAFLIGPMLAAVICGTNGATIRVPRIGFAAAQAMVGCLIAGSISPEIFSTFVAGWPLFLAVVVATLTASSFLGWFISRLKILPGTTALWGSAPGGATAMVLMAGAFGADARLVAFMQYLRVILVVFSAAMISRLWVDTSGVPVPETVWFPSIEWPVLAITAATVVLGGLAGRLARLPSPYFLGVVILGSTLHLGFGVPLQMPPWLLAMSYALIGWSIGLNFTSAILRHAARALPQIVASIVALIAFCGGLAWLLSHKMGVDPLTAFLATSPGGLDSVAIIAAASSNVDISFIMAMQSARLLIVLLLGPSLARLMSRGIKD